MVLRALAGSKVKKVMPKPPELRHGKDCASKSSCGSKQRRRPGRNKKSEQVPVVNFGRAGDGEHQAGEQTFVGVAFANKKEDEHAENVEPVFAAEQPPDIAIQKSAKDEEDQCAEPGKPVVEEPDRASVGSEDALPTEASVWPTFANVKGAENAVDGEPVVAAEQLSDIAIEKSARNKRVECSGDGQLVIEELELALATPEDCLCAEVKSAAAKPLAILSLQNNPAGFAQRKKCKSLFFDPTRLTGAALGASDGKRRRGGVSDEMSAPARVKNSWQGAHSALKDVGQT